MRKNIRLSVTKTSLSIFLIISIHNLFSQQTGVEGRVVDAFTNRPLHQVNISIERTTISATSDEDGNFNIIGLSLGSHILKLAKQGYISKRYPIQVLEGEVLNLNVLDLMYDFANEQLQISTIQLSDEAISNHNHNISPSIGNVLHASKDTFLNAVTFDFSPTFFRPRGLDNSYTTVLINGIKMNSVEHGRPEWTLWGGLNNVIRNQTYSEGISKHTASFGNVLGVNHIDMRASKFAKSSRISYASSNRSYTGRMMATYTSGLLQNNWAYGISVSRRFGNEGFIDGTLYDSNAVFVSVEKKLNANHSLNFTSFYVPNRRGQSAPLTKEVFDLKGNTYNPNWGWLQGKKKNSRIRETRIPVFILSHYWKYNKNNSLQTNIAYRSGTNSRSRLDNNGTDLFSLGNTEIYEGGGASSDINPIHQSYLPSYYLKDENPTALQFRYAYEAQKAFINDGQLSWDRLIESNQQNAQQGKLATYMLYNDVVKDKNWTINAKYSSELNDYLLFDAGWSLQSRRSENYAEVEDLLGGIGFLDVDIFGMQTDSSNRLTSQQLADRSQSDLRQRNRIVTPGDRYDYNYDINTNVVDLFSQLQCNTRRLDFFISTILSTTTHQRRGRYENGYFSGAGSLGSYGRSDKLRYTNAGLKIGSTFKIDGRQSVTTNFMFRTNAPNVRQAFVNPRQNNRTVSQLIKAQFGSYQDNEKVKAADIKYIFVNPRFRARMSAYYNVIKDQTDISFFFTQSISGNNAGFVQEILTGVDKQYLGVELGFEYQFTSTLKLKSAAALGQFTYANNPDLFISSTSNSLSQQNLNQLSGTVYYGKSALKNYHIGGGPQKAIQFGFEYRDPTYWWVGSSINLFSDSYLSISPFTRSSNFYNDFDGIPFNDYDTSTAKQLLRQERFDPYTLVNITAGKSWRIRKSYVGCFVSIQNIFNQIFKTGGFEQARTANYRALLQESLRETPVYGSRYFYGLGTTYYLNFNIKF